MDLIPMRGSDADMLSYNWWAWGALIDRLHRWGVDTCEFKGCNDGDIISPATCRAVAQALEAHLPELEAEAYAEDHADDENAAKLAALIEANPKLAALLQPPSPQEQMAHIRHTIVLWRTCGGYRQL